MLHEKFRRFGLPRAPYKPPELPAAHSARPVPLHTGIYCDCLGTLYSETRGPNHLLVAYLNEKYRRGFEVTLLSSTPAQSLPLIRDIGLLPEIVQSLTAKKNLFPYTLEILIDDNPPPEQKAKIIRDPNNQEFKLTMKRYLEECGTEAPRPT